MIVMFSRVGLSTATNSALDAVLSKGGEEECLVLPPQEAGGDEAVPEIGKGMDEVGAFSGGLDHEDPAANHAAGPEAADLQRAVYRRMQSDDDEAIPVFSGSIFRNPPGFPPPPRRFDYSW